MENKLKLVVVGDSYVGKTSLLFAYTKKDFQRDYSTTVFDNWAVTVTIDQRKYTVNLFDTAGQEDYAHLRTLSYPTSDVFLLCFSLVDKRSLEAAEVTWMPEIRNYAGDKVPVVLVGTKFDMIDKADPETTVSMDTARKAAQKMGCVKFIPCSSLTHHGLKQVFDDAILAGIGLLQPEKEDPRQCCYVL